MQGGFFLAQNEAHTNTNSALKAHEIVQFEKIGSTFFDVFRWETHHVWAPRNVWKFIEQDCFYDKDFPLLL